MKKPDTDYSARLGTNVPGSGPCTFTPELPLSQTLLPLPGPQPLSSSSMIPEWPCPPGPLMSIIWGHCLPRHPQASQQLLQGTLLSTVNSSGVFSSSFFNEYCFDHQVKKIILKKLTLLMNSRYSSACVQINKWSKGLSLETQLRTKRGKKIQATFASVPSAKMR